MEKHYRTIVKTLLYRVLSTCITIGGIYLFNRDFSASVSIGIGINLAKLAFYYFYERAWNRISFGRIVSPPEYNI